MGEQPTETMVYVIDGYGERAVADDWDEVQELQQTLRDLYQSGDEGWGGLTLILRGERIVDGDGEAVGYAARVVWTDGAWRVIATEESIAAIHADSCDVHKIEQTHPSGAWVVIDCAADLADRDDEAPEADAAVLARMIAAGQARVHGAIHGLPGASPLGALMM